MALGVAIMALDWDAMMTQSFMGWVIIVAAVASVVMGLHDKLKKGVVAGLVWHAEYRRRQAIVMGADPYN